MSVRAYEYACEYAYECVSVRVSVRVSSLEVTGFSSV